MPDDHFTAPMGHLLPVHEEIRQTQNAHLKAWNEGDAETYVRYVARDLIGFDVTGDLADHARPYASLVALYAAGYKPTFQYRDRVLRVYGDTVATTAYLVGDMHQPDGSVIEGVFRYSEVRVKMDGVWKLVQYHLSPLNV
jgi:ketosteroid isomerase-like protein